MVGLGRALQTMGAQEAKRLASGSRCPLFLRMIKYRAHVGRLFVGDSGAGGAGEVDGFEAAEAGVFAPILEIGGGVVEGVAEFYEHVEGHEEAEGVFAAVVVDEGFYGD